MALIFATGPEDTGAIMELAVKGPTLDGMGIINLNPKTASAQLLKVASTTKNLVATIGLAQKTGELIRFPYPPSFFARFRPDTFIILETGDDPIHERVNTHVALSSSPDAVKIIKVDRDNIKKAIVDIRKALAQILEG